VYSFPDFIRIQQAAQTILDSFIIVVLYGVVMLSTIMLQLFQMFKKILCLKSVTIIAQCCCVCICQAQIKNLLTQATY